ncbi:hypothetical protein KGF54_004535 [Candida jiufengensis]|uniref:uncharacterized protein n=1 Tax=Candida jiufengensis TaxID=497108 RepID=UPI0022245526|nr:uncharacterized protein KGF54_004535 [Candida jiufengensis]KAI5951461.1 hypothetical protein KGF54_004535 [Candida jiufengensis]
MARRKPLFEEDKDYINEDHISDFAKALIWQDYDTDINTTPPTPKNEPIDLNDDDDISSTSSSRTEEIDQDESYMSDSNYNTRKLLNEGAELGITPTTKPDMITSKSDWFPINNENIKKKTKSNVKNKNKQTHKPSTFKILQNEFRNSASYTLLRWPILIFVFIWIAILGFLYFIVRVYVALSEYFFTWTGERKKLRDKLRNSTSYEEWIKNAKELDKYLHLDKWSENPKFSYYDYKTVRLTLIKLKKARTENKISELLILLQGCLKRNFAGIENRQLYSHRYYGTKNLVQEYNEEVVLCIDKILNTNDLNIEVKWKFFKIVSKNYGKSALCLSGGACFAYTHFGVAKALLDNDLLPNIVSGTSGGGLIAALVCTRTNEELHKLLVPELARKITACEDPWYVWIPRFIKTGARFDAVAWARKSNFFTRGSTTFEEAFERTGRKLNISTVPADPHSPVILCNDITSPHCIIWSTLLASSAVPGILNPVVLMMKNPETGQSVPFSLGSKWRDGSLRTDIPIDALNTYYHVNFTIVSQVNPHISLFFFAPKGTVGRPVSMSKRKTTREKFASFRGGFIATALEQLFRLEIKKWLQIVKSLDLLPNVLQQDWSNIWLQNFTGSITIWPRNKLKDFWYILSDPSEKQLEEIILKGERSMYPKLLFIKNRISIERSIAKGRQITTNKMKEGKMNVALGSDDEDENYEPSDYDFTKFKKSIGLTSKELEDQYIASLDEADDDELDDFYGDDEDGLESDIYDSDVAYNNGNSPRNSREKLKLRRNTIF